MLVLTRKVNECILIDSTIEVRILKTHNNKVMIGLSAPQEIPICRGELLPRIKADTEVYAHASPN
jgi:carbon storage regulator CsrA